MKVRIPKDMRGVVFLRLLTLEMNDFDIDIFLPQLFFRILASGKERARRVNEARDLRRFVDKLATHPDVEGFSDTSGRRVLDRLVRTEMVVMGGAGRGRQGGEQILSTVPYSLLTHKTGFPTAGSRQRGVDSFLYYVLRDTSGADDALRHYVKQVFGKGIIIGPQPTLGGRHDGVTDLDTLTRLSIAFLDGFEAVHMGKNNTRQFPPACPVVARGLGEDILKYLFMYGERMPPQALTYNFLALVNCEIFVYTLKLVHAINTLVRAPATLPPAMREHPVVSTPELYLDFTNVPNSLSQRMAADCVRRDIEAYQQFLTSNLLLRQLDRYVEHLRQSSRHSAEITMALGPERAGPEYFQRLLLLMEDPVIGPLIEWAAQQDEDAIRNETLKGESADSTHGDTGAAEEDVEFDQSDTVLDMLKELVASARTDIEKVVMLLIEGQQKQALEHYVRWYWSVGGLKKPHGILAGNIRSRHSWRYAPSNDLLAVFVQLAAAQSARIESRDTWGNMKPEPIRLQDFLAFLETRFGILVDRPPSTCVGAEYTAAARENLRAMLRRLRQMGIFSDLSDDFTVQRLRPPYADDHN